MFSRTFRIQRSFPTFKSTRANELLLPCVSVQVAAGLQVELQVQLFAMSAVTAGEVEPKTRISQDIVICTETEVLYLHVTANILQTHRGSSCFRTNFDLCMNQI